MHLKQYRFSVRQCPLLLLAAAGVFLFPLSAAETAGRATPIATGVSGTSQKDEPTAVELDEALLALHSDDWILRWEAMNRLAAWSVPEALDPLRALVDDAKAEPWIRGQALLAVSRFLGDKVQKRALALASASSPLLRAAAIETLGGIPSSQSEAAVRAALTDTAPRVRYEALVAWARLKKGGARKELMAALQQKDDIDLVRYAVRGLANVATRGPIQEVIKALSHSSAEVRLEAVRVLGALKPEEALLPLLERMATDSVRSVSREAEKVFTQYDPARLTVLLSQCRSKDKRVGQATLRVLLKNVTPAIGDALWDFLKSGNKEYDYIAAPLMARLATYDAKRYRGLFTQFLSHADMKLRCLAVKGLAKTGGEELYALLAGRVGDSDTRVCYEVISALQKNTEKVPAEGIVAYLAPLFKRKLDIGLFRNSLAFMEERIQPAEAESALALLKPILVGPYNHGVRDCAVKVIQRTRVEAVQQKVPGYLGYISDWNVAGPFLNGDDVAYAPEREIDFEKTYSSGGVAGEGLGFGAACSVQTHAVKDKERKAIAIQLPHENVPGGTLSLAYVVAVPPEADLVLQGWVGLLEAEGKRDAVRYEIWIDGQLKYVGTRVRAVDGWAPFQIDLSSYAGKTVPVRLVASARTTADDMTVLFAEPRIMKTRGKVFHDLMQLLPKAKKSVAVEGRRELIATWKAPILSTDMQRRILFHEMYEPPTVGLLAYALCELESATDQTVRFVIGIEVKDQGALWVNGVRVPLSFASRWGHGNSATVNVALQKGRNRVLLRVGNPSGAWSCSMRVLDKQGARAMNVRPVSFAPVAEEE